MTRKKAESIKAEATRISSGKVVEQLIQDNDKIIVGSADLAGSNNLKNKHIKPISKKDFSGNFINYGIREHAMAGIMNGLALSSFLPIGGTFFVFSDYMRPSIRLATIMNLPVIYVMTHDSIGVGEDGPTHQPIEHLASFRAMPNINVFRPCDETETQECYELAINSKKPAIIALSRQATPPLREGTEYNNSERGGYIISKSKSETPIITIFATGTEVALAVETQTLLEQNDIPTRVCSVPCMEILLEQEVQYIEQLRGGAKYLTTIEAGSSFGWAKIIGKNGMFFGLDEFGASAPAKDLYQHFGLTSTNIAGKLQQKVKEF